MISLQGITSTDMTGMEGYQEMLSERLGSLAGIMEESIGIATGIVIPGDIAGGKNVANTSLDVNNMLNEYFRYADLLSFLQQIGSGPLDENLGEEILKSALFIHNTYGPQYLVDTAERILWNPRAYGLKFPLELGGDYIPQIHEKDL